LRCCNALNQNVFAAFSWGGRQPPLSVLGEGLAEGQGQGKSVRT
jgi:hypothetical protein